MAAMQSFSTHLTHQLQYIEGGLLSSLKGDHNAEALAWSDRTRQGVDLKSLAGIGRRRIPSEEDGFRLRSVVQEQEPTRLAEDGNIPKCQFLLGQVRNLRETRSTR